MPDDLVSLIDFIGRQLGRLSRRWRTRGGRTPDDSPTTSAQK